jgi:hypothetical protein
MRDPLPMVFLHYRNSAYLPFTLAQAKLASPASPLILLGDETNDVFPYVTHANMNAYHHGALEFQKHYRHLSPNGQSYELFCFMRWFILRDFMRAHALSQVVHVDSDVLLYADVNRERERWADYDITVVREVCAGNMFVNSRRAIEDLCDVIRDLYTAPGADARLSALYDEKQKTGEGISDMVAFKLFYDANRSRVGEMTGLQPDQTWWDANIHLSEGFEIRDGRKRIEYHDRQPHARRADTGQVVRFMALHFQGVAKRHIEPAFRQGVARAIAA